MKLIQVSKPAPPIARRLASANAKPRVVGGFFQGRQHRQLEPASECAPSDRRSLRIGLQPANHQAGIFMKSAVQTEVNPSHLCVRFFVRIHQIN